MSSAVAVSSSICNSSFIFDPYKEASFDFPKITDIRQTNIYDTISGLNINWKDT